MRKLLSIPFLAVLLTSCTTTTNIDRRIAKHPDWFQELSRDRQLLVEQGRIEEGMGKNAVFLAWGPPSHVSEGRRGGADTETWVYDTYEPRTVTRFGASYGYGFRPYGYGGFHDPYCSPYGGFGPYVHDVEYVRVPNAKVVFRNSRVVEWESSGR